jgi:hypothetical protein
MKELIGPLIIVLSLTGLTLTVTVTGTVPVSKLTKLLRDPAVRLLPPSTQHQAAGAQNIKQLEPGKATALLIKYLSQKG